MSTRWPRAHDGCPCSDCQHDDRTTLDLLTRWGCLVGGVLLVLLAMAAVIIERLAQ